MHILIRPYMTEKTMAQAQAGFYTFVVAEKSNKAQIAEAVAKQYNVHVTGVRTSIAHGKIRRVGRKMLPIAKSDWKKAIVTLKSGQKIDAFEVHQEEAKK